MYCNFLATKGRGFVVCTECGKRRVIYTSRQLNKAEEKAAERVQELLYIYLCGNPMFHVGQYQTVFCAGRIMIVLCAKWIAKWLNGEAKSCPFSNFDFYSSRHFWNIDLFNYPPPLSKFFRSSRNQKINNPGIIHKFFKTIKLISTKRLHKSFYLRDHLFYWSHAFLLI